MASKPDVSVELDFDEIFQQANESTQVRAAVLKRATDIAVRARRIDAQENAGHANITIEERVMPNGRYVVQVQTDDVSGEHGDSVTERRRTLRRASGSSKS